MKTIPSIESILEFEHGGILLVRTPPTVITGIFPNFGIDDGTAPPPTEPANSIWFNGISIQFNGQNIVYN
jgi:hypothetical protein